MVYFTWLHPACYHSRMQCLLVTSGKPSHAPQKSLDVIPHGQGRLSFANPTNISMTVESVDDQSLNWTLGYYQVHLESHTTSLHPSHLTSPLHSHSPSLPTHPYHSASSLTLSSHSPPSLTLTLPPHSPHHSPSLPTPLPSVSILPIPSCWESHSVY